jgi:hypothetical protein
MKSFLEFWNQINEENPPVAQAGVAQPQAGVAQPQAGMAQQKGQKGFSQSREAIRTGSGTDPVSDKKLKDLLGKQYEQFVSELGSNITDKKFSDFLLGGLTDGKMQRDDVVKFSNISIPCSSLKPTQNEIDIDKSLSYPLKLTPTSDLIAYFNGGTFAPGGKIVTCGGGKYIIDGHHRWSQLYCMNPNAKIEAIDMTSFKSPYLALKVTQLAIAATANKIPIESVSGTNLIGINENALKEYIYANIGKNAIAAFVDLMNKSTNSSQPQTQESNSEFILNYFKRLDEYEQDGKLYPDYDDGRGKGGGGVANQPPQENKQDVIDRDARNKPYLKVINFAQNYLWKNVQIMNANNKPINGASKRDFMPQTDKAAGWDTNLKAGKVNWKQECLILSGLIMRD